MIRTQSHRQLSLAEFDWPFQTALDSNHRWVKMSHCIPWDDLADAYYQGLSATQSRPAKDARLVIGGVIITHRLCLSDRETVAQIQENPYLQYFVGLPGYQMDVPFLPSLFVEIRKRMGRAVFDVFHNAAIVKKQRPGARLLSGCWRTFLTRRRFSRVVASVLGDPARLRPAVGDASESNQTLQ